MTRGVHADVKTAIGTRAVRPRFFLELEFASGFVRLHSGIGQVSFQGATYSGSGSLGRIGPVQETQDVKSTGVAFELSGLPAATVALALDEDYQGRSAKLWLALVDAAGAVIGNAVQVFAGLMDTMPVELGGAVGTVRVTAESHLARLRTSSNRLYTAGDQQADHPDDKGFDYTDLIVDKEFIWGGGKDRAFADGTRTTFATGGGGAGTAE